MASLRALPCLSLLVAGLASAATEARGRHPYFSALQSPEVQRLQLDAGDGPVILIIVDALRPDHMSAYGSALATTPNLKALADEGVVFTSSFANSNWTKPSTASLLTGLLPNMHGVQGARDRLPDHFETFPETLQRQGVPTGAVVGNGNAGSAFGMHQGFDFYADTVKHWQGLPTADEVTALAEPFIDAHRDQRFFLLLFVVDPHDPYHAPGEYDRMFIDEDQGDEVRLVRSPHWEIGNYSPAEVDKMKRTYDGAIRYTDAALGRFFTTLRRKGLYDKSTIIVTSDHGEAFGEHGVFLHSHHLYDELVRVPLIVRTPRMSRRGVRHDGVIQSIDLAPSLLAAFGQPKPATMPGLDFFGAVAGPMGDRPVVAEYRNFGIWRLMARREHSKVIWQQAADRATFMATVGKPELLPSVRFEGDEYQLFDLRHDPMEKKRLPLGHLKRRRFARLKTLLEAYVAAGSGLPATVVDNLDPETTSDLRALGYIQ